MNQLNRLFKAAARVPQTPPGPMPVALATRVLAQCRAVAARPDLAWLTGWFRVGLAGACTILLLSLAWSFQSNDTDSIGDLVFMNQTIQETSIR